MQPRTAVRNSFKQQFHNAIHKRQQVSCKYVVSSKLQFSFYSQLRLLEYTEVSI